MTGLAGVLYSARDTGAATGGALLVPYFSASAAFRSAACTSALVGSCTAAVPSILHVTRFGLYRPSSSSELALVVLALRGSFDERENVLMGDQGI